MSYEVKNGLMYPLSSSSSPPRSSLGPEWFQHKLSVHDKNYSIVQPQLSAKESRKLFEKRAARILGMTAPPAGVSKEYLEEVQGAYLDALIRDPTPATRLEYIPIAHHPRDSAQAKF